MKKLFSVIFLALLFCLLFSETTIIKYSQTDYRYEYRIKLLELALNKTIPKYGDFELVPLYEKSSQKRSSYLLEKNIIDVIFFPTNIEREKRFLPIKEPILKGILGYRVLLNNKANKIKFSNIPNLDYFKENFIAGFGSQWADMVILKDNNIKVIGSATYLNLFDMLENKRFDYFHRGINEAWKEIEEQGSKYPNLMIESKIALYYPYAVYFFVNKSNNILAERIKLGLKIAESDGSFKKLFLDYHQKYIQLANIKNRTLFTLKNKTLPPETPIIDTSWWLNN